MQIDEKCKIIFTSHIRLLQLNSLITLGLLVLIIINHFFIMREFGKDMWKTIGLSSSANRLRNIFPTEILFLSLYGICLVAKVIFNLSFSKIISIILTGFVIIITACPYCLLRDINSKAFEFAENFQNLTKSEESIIIIGPAKVNSALKTVNASQISSFYEHFKVHFREKVSPLYKTHCILCATCYLCYFITFIINYQMQEERKDFRKFDPETKRRQLHNKFQEPVFKKDCA